MSILAQAPVEQLEQGWRAAGSPAATEWLRPAETGLVMVRGRAGGNGPRFNLGEMTATRCACRIPESDVIGYAMVSGRDTRKAELASLLDAVLQRDAGGAWAAQDFVEELDARHQDLRRAEAAKAAATRVDFFTMVRGG